MAIVFIRECYISAFTRSVVRAYLFLSHDGTFVTFCRHDDDDDDDDDDDNDDDGLGRVVTSTLFFLVSRRYARRKSTFY